MTFGYSFAILLLILSLCHAMQAPLFQAPQPPLAFKFQQMFSNSQYQLALITLSTVWNWVDCINQIHQSQHAISLSQSGDSLTIWFDINGTPVDTHVSKQDFVKVSTHIVQISNQMPPAYAVPASTNHLHQACRILLQNIIKLKIWDDHIVLQMLDNYIIASETYVTSHELETKTATSLKTKLKGELSKMINALPSARTSTKPSIHGHAYWDQTTWTNAYAWYDKWIFQEIFVTQLQQLRQLEVSLQTKIVEKSFGVLIRPYIDQELFTSDENGIKEMILSNHFDKIKNIVDIAKQAGILNFQLTDLIVNKWIQQIPNDGLWSRITSKLHQNFEWIAQLKTFLAKLKDFNDINEKLKDVSQLELDSEPTMQMFIELNNKLVNEESNTISSSDGQTTVNSICTLIDCDQFVHVSENVILPFYMSQQHNVEVTKAIMNILKRIYPLLNLENKDDRVNAWKIMKHDLIKFDSFNGGLKIIKIKYSKQLLTMIFAYHMRESTKNSRNIEIELNQFKEMKTMIEYAEKLNYIDSLFASMIEEWMNKIEISSFTMDATGNLKDQLFSVRLYKTIESDPILSQFWKKLLNDMSIDELILIRSIKTIDPTMQITTLEELMEGEIIFGVDPNDATWEAIMENYANILVQHFDGIKSRCEMEILSQKDAFPRIYTDFKSMRCLVKIVNRWKNTRQCDQLFDMLVQQFQSMADQLATIFDSKIIRLMKVTQKEWLQKFILKQ